MACYSRALMPDDLYFMELALAEARASAEAGEVPIGAVLVQNENVSRVPVTAPFEIMIPPLTQKLSPSAKLRISSATTA